MTGTGAYAGSPLPVCSPRFWYVGTESGHDVTPFAVLVNARTSALWKASELS